MNKHTAILAASFGTACPEAIARAIAPVEDKLALHTGLTVRRAFTSEAVRSRLMKEHGMQVYGIPDALEALHREGFESVMVQPLMLMPGGEYARLMDCVRKSAGNLRVGISEPLIRSEEDMGEILRAMMHACPISEDTLLVAMAHGSACDANGLYAALDRRLAGFKRPAAMCTIHGEPSFETLAARLSKQPRRNVHMSPFLLFPGTHARENMCGRRPGSLYSILTAAGFDVSWTLRGLCELPDVQQLFVRRAQAALDNF